MRLSHCFTLVLALILVGLICVANLCSAAESKKCRSLGFTGLQLCSDCDTMAMYVQDEGLIEDCHACCVRGKSGGDLKYSAAVLEVNLNRLGAYPHIQGFIDNHAHRYEPVLRVRSKPGAMFPRLVVTPAGGGQKQVVQIDGWKTEHVEEFLDDKLLQPEASMGAKASA